MATQITKHLLFALVLSLGFGQLLRLDFLGLPLAVADILVVAVVILNIRALTRPGLGIKLLLTGLALGWLSAVAAHPPTSLAMPFLYTLRLLAYLGLGAVLKSTKAKLPLKLFFVSGGVSLFIGYLQYALLPDMRLFQVLGWDDHLGRLTLPHFDPTFSSTMFVLFGLLAIETKQFYLGLFALPAVLLAYARSVWLSLFIVIFTRLRVRSILLILLVFTILVIVLPRSLGEGTNLLRTYSISSRITHDVDLAQSVGWGMLVGVGYNMLWVDPTSHAAGANNSYLQILLTTGILGLIGLIMILRQLLRLYPFPLSLKFVLVASLFNNVLLYPTVMLWLILSSRAIAPTATSRSR